MKRWLIGALVAVVPLIGWSAVTTKPVDENAVRQQARKAMGSGNWRDAFDQLARLAAAAETSPDRAGEDLTQALTCLGHLGRVEEGDELRERTITAHADQWRVLWTAATSYQNTPHYGTIVAGKFYRGDRRGNDGKRVGSYDRDRTRALQLMQQAMEALPKARPAADKSDVAAFHFQFAHMLLNTDAGANAWRLQYLSDLTKLPDYDERGYGYYGRYAYEDRERGAPVKEDGTPVYHAIPRSYREAATDGERWRWCLERAAELSPAYKAQARMALAHFLRGQFDVQTMGAYRGFRGANWGPTPEANDEKKDEAGPFAVSTLKEDETIAKLASGIKRFQLPAEFNFVRIFQEVAADDAGGQADEALQSLAQVFEDRQQYPRAADYWRESIKRFGPGPNDHKKDRLQQVVGNWGMFEPVMTQPAGREPTVEFRYRNGAKVSFEATEIDQRKLLADVKASLKAAPRRLNWEDIDIQNLGHRLVERDQKQYLGAQAAAWDLELKPREKHFDRRVTVKTPLKKAGAYLLTAKMADGNLSRIILWVADTIIVRKPLTEGYYYYVGDALTGAPVGKANVEFFGYQQRHQGNDKWDVVTTNFAENADENGQLTSNPQENMANYSWLITATTPDGRFAYMGFTGAWHGRQRPYDAEYNQEKVFVITDRPVYRPGHTAKFKVWVGQAKYDQEGKSPYAGGTFMVEVRSPKGDKLLEKSFTADEYGGFDGEVALPKEATLGQYAITVRNHGGGNFRVEEYKKPEFEVKVDAPTEPVALGEKITATVQAKYYFGAPVTDAKVKFKVLRTTHNANWYPLGRWDWMYEPGYWWFAYDYLWYPGFGEWGCRAPRRSWWGVRPERPEVVLQDERPVGPDGTLKVEIDTAIAKAVHGDQDHSYAITAEVTDQSRRTIVGTGTVIVARKPFKVYAWVDRGHYRAGDAIEASFNAQTLDRKPVRGKGELRLLKVAYDDKGKPVETVAGKWALDTNDEGLARQQIKAAVAGQYRLSYTVTDDKKHAIEGGYLFQVTGEGFTGKEFRFNDIELIPDKREYAPAEKVKLMINTNRDESTVLLFAKPANGIYLPPRILRLKGKSTVEEIEVAKRDMPNMFVEAVTIGGGRVHQETREIVVPPEKRVLSVEVLPTTRQYKPGEKATVKIRLLDPSGEPFQGSTVVSVYDKSVEYISGGSNVPDIKAFFWKWRRHHYPSQEHTAMKGSGNLHRSTEKPMRYLGVFGVQSADWGDKDGKKLAEVDAGGDEGGNFGGGGGAGGARRYRSDAAPAPTMALAAKSNGAPGAAPMEVDAMQSAGEKSTSDMKRDGNAGAPAGVEPTVRKNFADTALWVGTLKTDKAGLAQFELTMPENLTTWKARVWAIGDGTRVGDGSAEVVTTKNLIVRLQAPRFFTQKDEVVLSANVHNYLKTKKTVKVTLDLEGDTLVPLVEQAGGAFAPARAAQVFDIEVAPGEDKRVDWRVRAIRPGTAVVRVRAITDEESDATQMSFPAYVHGMLKTESWSGALRPGQDRAQVVVRVPQERLPEQTVLEVRYSPSVAMAMVDALPYLVDYPYGCTEQTLNRFLPAVITQKVLTDMKLDLKDIHAKRTNLNAQEIGDDKARATQWKRFDRNPVFDESEMKSIVKDGLTRLTNQQCADGGWGWFSGTGEASYPHTTALVVHGLQIARQNDVALVPGVLERGVQWLQRYQAQQVALLKAAAAKKKDTQWKEKADNLDAFAYMVLADANVQDKDMLEFLYRDRNDLAVHAKATYGLALHKQGHKDKLAMIMQNIGQFLVKDDENQTAYLKMPEGNHWWYWYGSEYEAQAYYLKLLSKTDPKGETGGRMAKYLVNNRKHATYWQSTRDTAVCVEALADFIRASGEAQPRMTLEILVDGKKVKEVTINASNLFTYDNKLVLTGEQVTSGEHKIEIVRKGEGPLYFNAYLTNFTLEDPITRAGLEVRVNRKFYKLVPVDQKIKVAGSRGQALDQKVEKHERQEISNLAVLKSGDLVEVELEIDSKNDYEYILFEDMKAAGFEPVEVRSGYNGNDLNAYMELRDERVCFFARTLARGKHSVSYRLRAEIPGAYSALPARASGMYAPELRGNSDEFKVGVKD